MIRIGKITRETKNNKARVSAPIEIDNQTSEIWFEVDKKYCEYLCVERSDAFLIGVLNFAMRNGHDIVCDSPLGEELFFNLENHLIDTLFLNSKNLYRTKIKAEIDFMELPCAGGVGTGISCGIDSLHVLSSFSNPEFKNHRITHLCFNNVGSHGVGVAAQELYEERKELSRKFASEYGFEFVESNSNIYDVIPQNHLLTHNYSSTFAIYSLQKLFSKYYYASGVPYSQFSLENNDLKASTFYELLFFYVVSTSKIKVHSEGASLSRFEKVRRVVDFPPSYNYLNVCTRTFKNCGKCEKCVRTLIAIDALGQIEKYKNVFDIDYYKKHRQDYYFPILIKQLKLKKREYYIESYFMLKDKINYIAKIDGNFQIFSDKLNSKINRVLKKLSIK